jgi:PEP-CTERM motif
MHPRLLKQTLAFGLAAVLTVAACPRAAKGTSIGPGFDLFNTPSGSGAFVDLSDFGLPPDVLLDGADDFDFGFGNTDTIVQRQQGIDPLDPPFGSGLVDIEIVALHLVSVDPIDLTPLGGPFVGMFGDLHVTINKDGLIAGLPQLDPLPPSIGRMEIRHEQANGGTFDSLFGDLADGPLGVAGGGIYSDAIFTVPGGDPGNPLDVLFSQPAPRIVLPSTLSPWSHTRPALYPTVLPDGNFFPGVDPVTDQAVGVNHQGPHPKTDPAQIPEPGTLALLGIGGVMIVRRRG